MHIALSPSETRGDDPALSPDRIVELWRQKVGGIPGAEEVSFTSELMGAGKPIDVQLTHPDLATLRQAASDLKQELATLPGVEDISDSYRQGKREILFEVTPAGAALGVTREDLGRQMRQAFYGEEAQRMQRGREEVKVMVRYPLADRRQVGALDDFRVRLANGSEAPFDVVAEAIEGRGSATISRTDRRRTLNVTAEIDATVTDAGSVYEHLAQGPLQALEARYPGFGWEVGGERKEQEETRGGLYNGLLLALLAIYGLMAIPFRSYLQPLIVMTAIPFGMVGALLGHLIIGMDANVLSMCGMLALAGVVVNDNLVLVDTINRRRREGGGTLRDIVSEAGASRFRPILLTSLTTFAGLTPLMLETSLQAMFLIPMAVSLAFGVLFSTVVSLVLVPSLYLILEDIRAGFRWIYASGHGLIPAAAVARTTK